MSKPLPYRAWFDQEERRFATEGKARRWVVGMLGGDASTDDYGIVDERESRSPRLVVAGGESGMRSEGPGAGER